MEARSPSERGAKWNKPAKNGTYKTAKRHAKAPKKIINNTLPAEKNVL